MKLILFPLYFFVLGCTLFSRNPAQMDNSCVHSTEHFSCVQYLRNYDGDTITFNIPQVHPIIGQKIPIRVNGVDTPEITGKTDCEKSKAIEAKNAVQQILENATRIDLLNIQRGKYFRIVADVYADGVNLSDHLIKENLAYPYDGKTKPNINWCSPSLD